jgi:hypothetical protein
MCITVITLLLLEEHIIIIPGKSGEGGIFFICDKTGRATIIVN